MKYDIEKEFNNFNLIISNIKLEDIHYSFTLVIKTDNVIFKHDFQSVANFRFPFKTKQNYIEIFDEDAQGCKFYFSKERLSLVLDFGNELSSFKFLLSETDKEKFDDFMIEFNAYFS